MVSIGTEPMESTMVSFGIDPVFRDHTAEKGVANVATETDRVTSASIGTDCARPDVTSTELIVFQRPEKKPKGNRRRMSKRKAIVSSEKALVIVPSNEKENKMDLQVHLTRLSALSTTFGIWTR